jgi:hypothetical protein
VVAQALTHPAFWLLHLPTALAWAYWAWAFVRNWKVAGRRRNVISLFIAAAALGWVVDAARAAGLLPATSVVNAALQTGALLVGVLGAFAIAHNARTRGPARGGIQ